MLVSMLWINFINEAIVPCSESVNTILTVSLI